MNYFKILCYATSILFIYLFSQMVFFSESFFNDLGLQANLTTSVLAKRVSIFMLGISILTFCARNLPYSKARQYICLSTGITMVGLACTGIYELSMGTVNSSMLTAIIIEIALGIPFLIIFFSNLKSIIQK